ncbi:MAG: hypothetical protein HJJLKODD_00826 [Phycisphaerae bacterium]|nr:hypothetical protein [Phycisphaerae bacterium]
MREYAVSGRTGVDGLTGRELAEGEVYYAVLFEEGESLVRREYAAEGWLGPPERYFCYWKALVPVKAAKKKVWVDNEVLMNLFVRLAESAEEVKQHFRFVLGLMLMRKRLLKYEETQMEEGQEWWIMRSSGEETLHRVWNPRLAEEQIVMVSEELSMILHGETGMENEDL